MDTRQIEKIIKKYLLLAAVLILIIINFQRILAFFQTGLDAFSNIFFAMGLAYVVNIIMVKIEALLKKSGLKKLPKLIRPLSLLLSLIILFALIATFIGLILPTLITSISTLITSLPGTFNDIQTFLLNLFKDNPQIEQSLNTLELDWKGLLQNSLSFLGGGIADILDRVLNITGILIGGIFNFLLIFVFAIYILLDKERFARLYHRLMTLYSSPKIKARVELSLGVIHQTFSAFISGQCLEAVILGTLCAIGMLLLNMPYAIMIGTLVGVINIIPIVGAYVGGAIGMFLVFTVNPIQSVAFLVYLIILQQFESNIIYPRVVGNSVGLPGIFVLGSVIVFGALAGIPGMFLGIPTMASVYKLSKLFLAYKERKAAEKKAEIASIE